LLIRWGFSYYEIIFKEATIAKGTAHFVFASPQVHPGLVGGISRPQGPSPLTL